MLIVEFLQ